MRKNKGRAALACISFLFLAAPAFPRMNSTQLYGEASARALSGDIEEAITGFIRVIEANPHYALGHYGLGKAYLYKEGKLEEAIRHLRLSVECDRRLAKGYFYLGMACMLAGKYGPALHAFGASYEYDRGMVEALYNMAVIYDLIGADSKARRLYEQYVGEWNKKESNILF
jgi:tetratricopeptide (TPR) repeat protein